MGEAIAIAPKKVGSGWRCSHCNAKHTVSIYVSLHMREGLTHTCTCGLVSDVRNWKVRPKKEPCYDH